VVSPGPKAERQRRIARLLQERRVTSQNELVGLLTALGHPATQATVSRDLEELGAVKVRRNGRIVYALPPPPEGESPAGPPSEDVLQRVLSGSVLGVEASGNLVVVHTPPGHAGMVASAVDRALVDGVAGTVAGDDTILVVCRQDVPARKVESRLRHLAALVPGGPDGSSTGAPVGGAA
jgi:transcriptional regulator of arginine metabolism